MKKRMNYNGTQNIIRYWPAFIINCTCYIARLQDFFLDFFTINPSYR